MYCETCKHWVLDKMDEYNEMIFPYKPHQDYEQCETEEEAAQYFGNRVRRCRNPNLLFYQRPTATQATVVDGSQYRAELLTGEKFGCINFEPLAE